MCGLQGCPRASESFSEYLPPPNEEGDPTLPLLRCTALIMGPPGAASGWPAGCHLRDTNRGQGNPEQPCDLTVGKWHLHCGPEHGGEKGREMQMELDRDFNKEEPGPLSQGRALHPFPHSLRPTNFPPLTKCQRALQMPLETYPGYTGDSESNHMPSRPEQKPVSMRELRESSIWLGHGEALC